MDSNDLEASVFQGNDDLRLLRSFPAECVDLVYLDSPFFSGWVHESIAPLEDLHRVLKPTGALFLVCDEAVGLYVRFMLEELFDQQDGRNRMVWWKADSGPAHHYVFYYRKFAQKTAGRNGRLYTVIRREGKDDSSLVAFSFVHGRPRRRISKHLPA